MELEDLFGVSRRRYKKPSILRELDECLSNCGIDKKTRFKWRDIICDLPACFELKLDDDIYIRFNIKGKFKYIFNIKE